MMINDCYKKDRFTQDRGPITVSMQSNFFNAKSKKVQSAGISLDFEDDRFYDRNEDYLFDFNTLEQQSVGDDVSCPIADSILNACMDIIDAAQYIGVTFDIRKGKWELIYYTV